MSDDNTPDNPYAPLLNLLATTGPLVASSTDVKRIAGNFGLEWFLPYFGLACIALGVLTGLNWLYRRAIGRRRPWALWLRDKMPWNGTRYV